MKNPNMTIKEATDLLERRRRVLLKEMSQDIQDMMAGNYRQLSLKVKSIEGVDSVLQSLKSIDYMASHLEKHGLEPGDG